MKVLPVVFVARDQGDRCKTNLMCVYKYISVALLAELPQLTRVMLDLSMHSIFHRCSKLDPVSRLLGLTSVVLGFLRSAWLNCWRSFTVNVNHYV